MARHMAPKFDIADAVCAFGDDWHIALLTTHSLSRTRRRWADQKLPFQFAHDARRDYLAMRYVPRRKAILQCDLALDALDQAKITKRL